MCQFVLLGTENYCPNCGQKIKDMILSTDLGAQIRLYAVSVFLPPFGLGTTLKYIRSEDSQARMVGWVSLGLTVVALLFGIWSINSLMQGINQQLNQQLNLVGF